MNLKEISEVYETRMVKDFPDDERKPLEMLKEEHTSGLGRFLGYYENNQLIGYASVLKAGDYALLDYFAVSSSLRGKGIGTAFLKELGNWFSEARALLVESEAMASEQALRRIRFYEKAGCLSGTTTVRLYHVDYRILALPLADDFSVSEISTAIHAVYNIIYPTFLNTPLLVFSD